MSIGIRKQQLDFEILPTNNTKTLIFADTSDYYEEPQRPLLQITLPGHNKYLLTNVVARKINTFNSNTIGLTETLGSFDLIDLPDGVWTFIYKVCPYDKLYIQKYHLRTAQLETKLKEVYRTFDLSDCDVERDVKIREDVVDILLGIESGKANAEEGYFKKASDIYQRTNTKLTNLLDKLSGICHVQSVEQLHDRLSRHKW